MKMKDLCADERPREKMLAKGAESMSNAELLAILIGSGTRKENVLEVANRLLAENDGKLSAVAGMDAARMKEIGGIGSVKYASIAAAFELGKRCCLEDPGIEKVSLTDPEFVYRLMLPHLLGLKHEESWIILLNRANYVIHKEMVSSGGLTSTVVDPKVIMKKAIDKRASGIVLVHNHPSGNPRPGRSDLSATAKLKEAANTCDIALLDHIIICDDCYFSFADDRVVTVKRGGRKSPGGRESPVSLDLGDGRKTDRL